MVHLPLLSFISKTLRACTTPSLLPCGRRETAERWRMESSLAHKSTLRSNALRCTTLPITQTRGLSPTAGAVSPLSGKEDFPTLHYPLPSFMSKSLQACTALSLLPCGRRGTACGGGWRTRWLIRVPCIRMPYVAPPCQSAGSGSYHPPLPWSPLFQRKRAFLSCTTLPISHPRRLSPTAGAVPPLSEKEGFASLHHPQPSFMSKAPRACTTPCLFQGKRASLCCTVQKRGCRIKR